MKNEGNQAARSVMSFEGIVEQGQIRLPSDVHLPEKARVYVVIPNAVMPPRAFAASPHLANPEQAADFIKHVIAAQELRAEG
jgi:hypothetical protein